MPHLTEKIKNALDECRMLILGVQVFVGFNFRSVFDDGFRKLPETAQHIKLFSLVSLLVTLTLLLLPGAYHRIVWRGEDSPAVHSFTTKIMDWALLPFSIAISVDMAVAAFIVGGLKIAVIAGFSAFILALLFWYGIEKYFKQPSGRAQGKNVKDQDKSDSKTLLEIRIEQALTEARVVLPGVQALAGFQFATILMANFEKLPESSKYIHLASLGLLVVAIILLMAPAAFHRIVEEGEDSELLHTFATYMLVAAMVPLAIAIAADVYVVSRVIVQSPTFAIGLSSVTLVMFLAVWFGYTITCRLRGEGATT